MGPSGTNREFKDPCPMDGGAKNNLFKDGGIEGDDQELRE
jgi:hypothetical protein